MNEKKNKNKLNRSIEIVSNNNENENKSVIYGDIQQDKEKSVAYDYESPKSAAYGNYSNKTQKIEQEHINKSQNRIKHINVGQKITLKNNTYEVVEIISLGTGEAEIYKIKKDNKFYALKLYYEFKNPKREPNAETLTKIKEIIDVDVLRLYDFGVGPDKYLGKHCFEISDFAGGGTVFDVQNLKEKYTLKFIKEHVISEIFNGIRTLNKHNIYHCDIKPDNIFYLDKEQTDIIIGDYGSAKTFNTKIDNTFVSSAFGTKFYVAPELKDNILSEKVDYFSFGMSLLHLLYYDEICEPDNPKKIKDDYYKKILLRRKERVPLIDYKKEYGEINMLIEGLTLEDIETRWGEKEVEKWLAGKYDELEVTYNINKRKYIINAYEDIETEKQLLNYITKNKDWKADLLNDETTRKQFVEWLTINYGKKNRVEIISLLQYGEQKLDIHVPEKYINIDYTKQILLRYIKPDYPLLINEKIYSLKGENLTKEVTSIINAIDEAWYYLDIEELRYLLFQLEFSLKMLHKKTQNTSSQLLIINLINKLYSSLDIKSIFKPNTENLTNVEIEPYQSQIVKFVSNDDKSNSYKRILSLFYVFNQKRAFRYKDKFYSDLEKIGFLLLKNPDIFNYPKVQIEKEIFLNRNGFDNAINLDYQSFIFYCFKEKVKNHVKIEKLYFDKHYNYKISYKFYKTLTDYFNQKGYNNEFSSYSDRNQICEFKSSITESTDSIYEKFISKISKKHFIENLSDENLNKIYKIIKKGRIKRFITLYFGQFLALVILIFLLSSNFLSSNEKNNINDYINTTTTNNDKTNQIKVNVNLANIRSGPSTDYPVIGQIERNNKLKVLGQDINSNWYEVQLEPGKTGFISNKIVEKLDENFFPDTKDYNVELNKDDDKEINAQIPDNNDFDENIEATENSDNINLDDNLKITKILIGKWKVKDNGGNYTFYNNNTGIYANNRGRKSTFHWSLDKNSLIITMDDTNNKWNWEILNWDNNNMEIYEPDKMLSRELYR